MLKGSVHCFTLSDIHIEKYQSQSGEGHKLVARVDGVELGPRAAGGQDSAPPAQRPAPSQAAQRPQPKPAPALEDDDIPF